MLEALAPNLAAAARRADLIISDLKLEPVDQSVAVTGSRAGGLQNLDFKR